MAVTVAKKKKGGGEPGLLGEMADSRAGAR